ncbi:MAG: thioredoxin family protein [Deltaproteobacteria bacterium]|nr:thioredoxin family protein [Deltaproteobacteria bacterium]
MKVLLSIVALLFGVAGAAQAQGKASLTLQLAAPPAIRGAETGIEAQVQVAAGWHINAHQPNDPFLIPTELKLVVPPGISSGTTHYPPPQEKSFAFAPGKKLLVHEGKVVITTTLNVPSDFPGNKIRVEGNLRYQACNDTTCSPPANATAELLVSVSSADPAALDDPPAAAAASLFDVGRRLKERGLAATLLLVALLGLGLNLTPCVYPLISVTLAYFGTRRGHHGRWHVGARALAYLSGIMVSFSIVGVVAALSGGIFGAALQKPIVLIGIAALMTAMALSSFGLFQLQPPPWLMRGVSGSTRGLFGTFFMGLTMGIVAAPCIGPVVVGLLLFVGARQDVYLGLELFLALGFGMGLPYVVLAMVAGSIKALPRSGAWLLWVERLFGFLLLGLAGYFLTPLLPRSAAHLILPALLAAAGVYLGFIDGSGRGWPRFRMLQRVVGLTALILAIWNAAPPRAESIIRWEPFSTAALATAQAAGHPMIIDFVADWCIPCHEMEATTFVDPDVQNEAARFATLRADMTAESDDNTVLTDKFQIQGVPTILLLDTAGNEIDRLVGYVGPAELLSRLRHVR